MRPSVLYLVKSYLWTVVVFIIGKLGFMLFCGHGLSAADGGQSRRETGRLQGEYLVRLAVKRQRQARRQFGRRLDLAGLHGATKIRMVGERTEF